MSYPVDLTITTTGTLDINSSPIWSDASVPQITFANARIDTLMAMMDEIRQVTDEHPMLDELADMICGMICVNNYNMQQYYMQVYKEQSRQIWQTTSSSNTENEWAGGLFGNLSGSIR